MASTKSLSTSVVQSDNDTTAPRGNECQFFVSAMSSLIDLVIVFRVPNKPTSKPKLLKDVQKAEQQYARLLETLKIAGLWVVGRQGEKEEHLLVLLWCPLKKLASLMRRERYVNMRGCR